MKALVVAGNPGARTWMRRALGRAWTTVEAADGLQARDLATDGGFDIVIADESTEPFGAFGLARELKILAEPPRVIVLLLRAQDAWLAKWSGADRWLLHPVDPVALARAAEEVLTADEQEGVATDADAHGEPLERAHASAGTPFTEARRTET